MMADRRPLPPVAQAGLAGMLLTFVVAFLAQQFGVVLLGIGIQVFLALAVGGLCAGLANLMTSRSPS